jgi:hypothetical protein
MGHLGIRCSRVVVGAAAPADVAGACAGAAAPAGAGAASTTGAVTAFEAAPFGGDGAALNRLLHHGHNYCHGQEMLVFHATAAGAGAGAAARRRAAAFTTRRAAPGCLFVAGQDGDSGEFNMQRVAPHSGWMQQSRRMHTTASTRGAGETADDSCVHPPPLPSHRGSENARLTLPLDALTLSLGGTAS